jgi:hypothetical protein
VGDNTKNEVLRKPTEPSRTLLLLEIRRKVHGSKCNDDHNNDKTVECVSTNGQGDSTVIKSKRSNTRDVVTEHQCDFRHFWSIFGFKSDALLGNG